MVNSNIAGVILAGGANKRFSGKTKANAIIGGEKIITRILRTIDQLFDEVIIVTNTQDEFTAFSEYRITSDHFAGVGPLAGIHAAMKVSIKDAVFVFAADMPFLDKKLIDYQIAQYLKTRTQILVPLLRERPEPLHAIYEISLMEILEKYLTENTEFAVNDFVKKVNFKYLRLEESEETRKAFMNINTPLDTYMAAKLLCSKS